MSDSNIGEGWQQVATVAAIREAGCQVVAVAGQPVALFWHDGRVFAVDNRCPHMGFPLSRGSLADGLLTCHWHHARFDLCSGGTLDPFADDVHAYPVRVEGDAVLLQIGVEGLDRGYWRRRLQEGLEQSITLVIAKAVLALRALGVGDDAIVAQAGDHGLRYRASGWSSGLTILTALANVLPCLEADDRATALVHGCMRVARDCAGQPARFIADPLPRGDVSSERLKSWFRRAVDVRDSEGAERVLRTLLASAGSPDAALDCLYAAATDHVFIDDGHTLDFITKAAEYLEHAGSGQAETALTSLVPGLCRASRSEEQYAWRYPIDLMAIMQPAVDEISAGWPGRGTSLVRDLEALVRVLLGEEPAAAVRALLAEFKAGVAPEALGQAVAYAAALRLARFPSSNEFGDWDTVHNTWSSCSALYRALQRAPSPELARGILHAAMALYLDRFLMVPPARLPEELAGERSVAKPREFLDELTSLFDLRQQVAPAARIVSDYLAAGYADADLLATLGHLTLREDAGFHDYQTLDAGVHLFRSLQTTAPAAARRTLVGVVRYLAAHAPTSRATQQTVRIAVRLQRGEEVFSEGGE